MSSRLWLTLNPLFLVACGLIACGRTLPSSPSEGSQQPLPDPGNRVSRENIIPVTGIILTPSSEVRHYLTTSTSVVQQTPDTVSGQPVIRMTLGFSLVYSRISPTQVRITGTLSGMSAVPSKSSSTTDQSAYLPLRFSGTVVSGGLYLDSLAGSPINAVVNCQDAGLNGITGVRRSIVIPPLLLSTGTTWTDSSTVPACSGSVLLALTTVRTYTVTGQTTRGLSPVIAIDRKDVVRATGEGAQGQHRISILSEGSGSARVYLDRTTGLLHESEGSQTIDLVIGSSGRSQRFRQVVEERTRLQQQ